jgi:hypothetical protein
MAKKNSKDKSSVKNELVAQDMFQVVKLKDGIQILRSL